MSEEDMFVVLSDAQRRHIAEFCIVPHSSHEVLKSVRAAWDSYHGSTLASDLRELENSGAVVFVGNKWKTTETAKKVLKKYFGLSM